MKICCLAWTLKKTISSFKKENAYNVGIKGYFFTNNQSPEIIIQTEQHTKCFLCSDEISVPQNVHGTIRVI